MKTVIVLGTARSGTSIISGMIHLLGVDMNPAHNPSVQNPKGSFEDPVFISLTTRMYLDLQKNVDVSLKYKSEIRDLVEKRSKRSELWGWKSALTHFVLDSFMPFVKNPHLVFVFRDPLANVQSDIFHKKVNYGLEISFFDSLVTVSKSLVKLAEVAKNFVGVPQIYFSFDKCRSNPVHEAKRLAEFLNLSFTRNAQSKITDFIIPDYCSRSTT